jgi:transposase
LPDRSFESGVWRKGTVNIDYHVEVDRHYYSVPYQLIHETADVRISASTVEFFVRGRRVASHVRSFEPYKATTDPAHMPLSHRQHAEWTPERLIGWAAQTGPAAANLVATLMARRPHPELGYRSCLGIIRLGRRYDSERLEAACARALAIDAPTYRSVEAILRAGLDRQPLPAPSPTLSLPRREHANVRGPAYYE